MLYWPLLLRLGDHLKVLPQIVQVCSVLCRPCQVLWQEFEQNRAPSAARPRAT